MRESCLAPQASHLIVPSLCSKSIFTPHESVLPQKGQSKMTATFGLAFLGGALAFFRFPLWERSHV